MKLQKNGLGYVLWALYGIVVGLVLEGCALWLIKSLGVEKTGPAVFLACSFLAVGIFLFCLLQGLFLRIRKPWQSPEASKVFRLEWMLVVFFAGLALAVRLGYLYANAHELAGGMAFYEAAAKTLAERAPDLQHNASYAYVRLLAWLFCITGVRPMAAIGFQMALQAGTLAVFYGAIRRLAGRVSALAFLLAAAFLPANSRSLHVLSPEMLVCLLAGIGLLAASYVYEWFLKKGKKSCLVFPFFFGLGIFLGLGAYFDIYGIVVFLAVAAGIWLLESGPEERLSAKERTGASSCLTLGLFTGIAFFTGIEAIVMGNGFWPTLKSGMAAWVKPFGIWVHFFDSEAEAVLYLGLCMAAGFGIIGFFRQRWQKFGQLAVLLAGCEGLMLCGQGAISYPVLEGLLFSMAAGIGLQYFADMRESGGIVSAQVSEGESGRAAMTERDLMAKEQAEKPEEDAVAEEIKYIPNPLPLPKRHVKRELDYGYEPQEKEMKFDLEELPEADDFDIE